MCVRGGGGGAEGRGVSERFRVSEALGDACNAGAKAVEAKERPGEAETMPSSERSKSHTVLRPGPQLRCQLRPLQRNAPSSGAAAGDGCGLGSSREGSA